MYPNWSISSRIKLKSLKTRKKLSRKEGPGFLPQPETFGYFWSSENKSKIHQYELSASCFVGSPKYIILTTTKKPITRFFVRKYT